MLQSFLNGATLEGRSFNQIKPDENSRPFHQDNGAKHPNLAPNLVKYGLSGLFSLSEPMNPSVSPPKSLKEKHLASKNTFRVQQDQTLRKISHEDA